MASEVDICNLALACLGDVANVASIDPPEASVQAQLCARFYPISRDALLESRNWGFATKRVQLAQVNFSWSQWQYAYAVPTDAVNLLAVFPSCALDDYENPYSLRPETKPFASETDGNGNPVILTNVPTAVLHYTALVTDTTQFSPLFVTTLAWHLASALAGPLLKGDVGADEAKRCMSMAQAFLAKAAESDANQRDIKPRHVPEFIRGRGIGTPNWLGGDPWGWW